MIAGLSEKSMKEVNAGIVPDLVVRSDPHLHGGEPGGLGGTDTLYDIKFLGPGGFYTNSASTKHGAVIESRANRVLCSDLKCTPSICITRAKLTRSSSNTLRSEMQVAICTWPC